MPFRKKRFWLPIVLASAVAIVLVAAALAATPGERVALAIPNVDPGLLAANLTEILDRFGNPDAWEPTDEAVSVASVEAPDILPYSPLEGDRCLRVTAPAGRSRVSVVREYGYPLNFTSAKWLVFGVCLPDEPGRYFTASVTVTWHDGTSYTASVPISGVTWSAALFKIGDYLPETGSALVSAIELSLVAADTLGFTAYIDALGTSNQDGFYTAMTCLTDKWYAEGGALQLPADGTLTLVAEDTDPFIETQSLRYNSFADTDALRIRLSNGAGCKSVTLYYTTYESPEFSPERSRTVEIQAASAPQTIYLPVTADYVGQIRLVFNGELRGDIKILSIMPVSTYVSRDAGLAAVTSCKITPAETIRIEGTLSETGLKRLRGTTLELYELECWQSADPSTISTLEPVESVSATHSFAFEFSLYRQDGSSRINSKFALVAIRDGVPILLDGYKYITNPEILAKVETEPSRPTLIRGASPAVGEPYGGTAQTVIEVSLPEIMSLTGTGSTFVSDGVVYAAESDYVEYLDETIRKNTENGVRVYLRLTTRYTGSAAVGRVFNYPGSSGSAVYAAFNTATVSGVGYLRAACEFLAGRYSAGDYSNGRVYGYIIGCSVETAYKYYNLGAASLSNFTVAYGNALRIAYNAIRSVAGAGPEVYAAFGSRWDIELTAGARYIYDSRSLIDSLHNMFSEEGDIGWQPSFDPFPDEDDYYAFADRAAGADYTADRITIANIDLLCSYFMRQQLHYGGAPRPILLCERPAHIARTYRDAAKATADYIYAVYKLSGPSYSIVCGFIITHAQVIDPLVLEEIDTQHSAAIAEPYKAVIGIGEWRELIPAFDEAQATKRVVTETEISDTPQSGAGKYTLFSFADGTAGWVGTLECEAISGGNSFSGREGLLRVKLSPGTGRGGIYTDFEYRLDLSIAPALGFELQLAAMPDGVDAAELTLLLTDGTNVARATGLVYPGRWNTVYADFSGFAGLRSSTRLVMTLRGVVQGEDGGAVYTDIGEPVIMISEINAYSDRHSDAELKKLFDDARDAALAQSGRRINTQLVWIASGVIIVATSLWVVYIMARLRRRDG
ncbi:MAG: DUF5722 domain-containing protein [Eubacteriales bacterium]|jgi:hypothetical protein|nr:hypothetical protein [Clostridiales bacterium]